MDFLNYGAALAQARRHVKDTGHEVDLYLSPTVAGLCCGASCSFDEASWVVPLTLLEIDPDQRCRTAAGREALANFYGLGARGILVQSTLTRYDRIRLG